MSDSEALDPWGMAWVHQVYRREFRLLPELIRGVSDGDTARSAIVTEHLFDVSASLLAHHHAEDELLWPLLVERAEPEASVVHRMEQQHEQMHDLLEKVDELAPRWLEHADAASRDILADLVAKTSSATDEHLADEEENIMPLVRKHVSAQEWLQFELRGHSSIPQDKALLFLGLGLEDATPHEREMFIGGLPPEVNSMWENFGKAEYAKAKARLHGTD